MTIQSTDFQVADFSGGITGDSRKANSNQSTVMNNMVITDKGSAKMRYGSSPIHQSIALTSCTGIYENNSNLYFTKAQELYKLNTNKTSSLVATVDGSALYSTGGVDVSICGRRWRNHLLFTGKSRRRPSQLFRDIGGIDRLTTVGLPDFTSTQKSAVNITGTSSSDSYFFAIVWAYEYTVNSVTYRKVSRTFKFTKAISGTAFSFVNIPVLDASDYIGDNHFDLANIKVELYSSIKNGSALFKLGEVSNGTTSSGPYTIIEATHTGNLGLYTNGGFLDHDIPPMCKDIQLVNDTAYYLNVTEEFDDGTTEEKPFRLVQSIPAIATSVNADFFVDLDADIIGGGVAGGNLIVFTDSFIYRIEGQVSASGSGAMRPITISRDIGCVSRDSIVSTKDGVFFAGKDGFYFTNGSTFKELTAGDKSLERLYRTLVKTQASADRINGTFDATNNRVTWGVSSTSQTTSNDQWWVYDINFDAFTTASGVNFYSTALFYDKEKIYRGDDFGYLYVHSEDIDCDYKRDSTILISSWNPVPIPWELSPSYFTNLDKRLWIRSVSVAIESSRDISVAINVDLINGRKYKMVPIIYKSNSVWRDIPLLWRDPSNIWKPSVLQIKRRRFPSGSSRTRGVTVSLNAAPSPLYISDTFGTATMTYKTPTNPIEILVELDNTNYSWPPQMLGYSIAFEHNDYKIRHLILAQSNDTLTISGGSTLVVANAKWKIIGVPNFQDIEIKSITYTYGEVGKEDNTFQKESVSDNA